MEELTEQEQKEKDIEDLFEKFFGIIKIRYKDFNPQFKLDDTEIKLISSLKEKYPFLTLEGTGGNFSISFLNMLQTIIKILIGKDIRLTADEERVINGIKFLENYKGGDALKEVAKRNKSKKKEAIL